MHDGHILYLAVADGRGHLMRAHLLRTLLGSRGIDVSLVTPSREGQAFLAALGSPSRLISAHFRLELGDRHVLDVRRTRARLLRYLLPDRCGRDLRLLETWARDADLVVNDSLHPALLAATLERRMRVVHVTGENIWNTTLAQLEADSNGPLRRAMSAALRGAMTRAFGRIFHTLGTECVSDRTWWLRPLVATPSRSREQVREALGVGSRPLAAVYLNPHYSAPEIAETLERALAARGVALYGVSEAFGGRQGWRARDARLAEVVHAADLFISGAGMAALEQSRAFGVPLLSLLGTQPEQLSNVAEVSQGGDRPPCVPVRVDAPGFVRELERGLDELRASPKRSDHKDELPRIQESWVRAFESLIHTARQESHHDSAFRRTGHRNGEPAGYGLGGR
ncbi:hypothetical protein HPC49_24085 [Pyxidicoccus fallax]|uniref:Glycosyltransferase family 1 protein n=1 Tax=Pyxidicoccus fallax TaxID=394095 RepID=A0A848LHX0_9BACT|nr:hypothetical protein [Pyxidicoccus fallax]NMO17361.1 glycosyltransferase family 1 protein [Pyxidicoccus fallax]NPC81295.1 hypothetical protein [Pyxidicoccus fallax]